MRKLYLFLVSAVLFSGGLNAQVTITGAAPTIADGTPYTSLTNVGGAFAAINAVPAWAGKNIVLTITANTAETGTNALNQPATSSWITLRINPSGARTVSGTVAASLVSLNGADNVTIDGLNSGPNALTIANLSTSAIAGTSTIKFINDASNNTVTNCTISGSATNNNVTPGGTILFSTGTTTGNDGNTISNSNIGPAGVNLPAISIYGKGSIASAAIGNSGVIINNNNIYDYFSAVDNSAGIYTEEGCNTWSITANRFYQSAGRTFTSALTFQHSAIWITGTTAASGAQLFTITNNIIGFATNTQTGTYTLSGSFLRFSSIYYSGITGAASTISSNTISSVSLSGSTFGDPFYGILIGSGLVTSNANVLGSQTATGSINVSANFASPGLIAGIYNFSSDNWISNNNTIGGITANNISTGNLEIYCLRAWTGAALTWTCTNNIIGGSVANSIQNITPGFASRVTGILNTSSIMTASGNTVRNLTANGPVEGISNSSPATISTNTISNLTLSASASSQLYAIKSTTASVDVFSNNISALSATGSSGIAVAISCSGATLNVYSNTINTLSSQGGTYGIYIPYGTTSNVYSNTINTLSTTGFSLYGIAFENSPGSTINTYSNTINTLSASSVASVYGISFYGDATTVNAYKNKIYDLSGSNAGSLVYGAYVNNPGPITLNFYNNLIGDLKNTNATGSGTAIAGYYSTSTNASSTQNVYYNTIYLNAVSAGALFSTSGIYHTASITPATAVLNLRNNIIVNTSTPAGAGTTVAYRRSTGTAGTLANYAATSNNNLFYAGIPGASNLIYSDGTSSATTLALYKAGVFTAGTIAPRDAASFSENPTWQSTAGATGNFLKYSISVPTQIESGAVNIATFTDDYGGTIRFGNAGYIACTPAGSAPDVGAWELCGIAADVAGPSISYTALGNTSCLTDRTLNPVTITDASSVNVTVGTKPRLYFKKSTEANAFAGNAAGNNGWKYVQATNAATPFTFTTNYALLNSGIVVGDVIQYFVVAADLATPTPNVGINTGTFVGATPTAVDLQGQGVTSIGGSPSSYTVTAAGISGTVTIGAFPATYPSLTGAGGLFSVINSNGISGNLTVNLRDASIAETGTNALNAVIYNGCAAAPYTITIKPDVGVTTVLTGSVSNVALIKLNGASNVIFDGSNSGGTDRSLTIINNSVTNPAGLWIGSTATGTMNNTIKNCNISTGSNASASLGIAVSSATTIAANGADNDNVTIQNNNITRCYVGILAWGTTSLSAGGLDNLNINNNIIGPVVSGTGNIGLSGINIAGAVNVLVNGNTVQNIATADAGATGIYTQATVAGAIISQNTVQNLTTSSPTLDGIVAEGISGTFTISQNVVSNITATAGSDYITGIEVTVPATIERNNISGISNGSTGTYGAYGINLASGNNHIVRNNFISGVTANMSGGFAFSTTFGVFGIRVASGTGHQIHFNSVNLYGLRSGSASSSLLSAAFGMVSTASTGCDVRNNIFANTISGGTTSIANTSVYLPVGGTSAMNLTWNYNAYFCGTDAARQGIGQRGTTAGTGFYLASNFNPNSTAGATNLRNYTSTLLVANTNNDNASIGTTVAAPFISSSNLHLNPASSCFLDGYGTPIAGITTDYDVQTRDAGAPDMGADEFTTSPVPSTITTASNCDTKNVSPTGTLYVDASCNLIAKVLPSGGGTAVSGKIKTCTTLDVSQQTFNAQPYVQRHYDIEPTTNPATATGTITLYFTDLEFIQYNTNYPAYPPLPTNGVGNTPANRNNVKVTQFHGVGSTSPTKPGFYPGTAVLIIPGAANVIFNGTYWEVTFNVTGFSGFYVHTNNFGGSLPIIVNYLTGRKQGSNHLLNWKVTCTTSPRATMTLERSADARNYTGINTITADAARCNSPFDYTDANPLSGMNYYRLKIVDADGKVTYSTTVALLNAVKGFDIISIAPNPVVSDNFKLNVASALAGKMEIVIFDLQGRLVNRQSISVTAGFNSLPINVANLSSGTYTIYGTIAEDKSRVIRFVKQ